jgi:hypothetical protein
MKKRAINVDIEDKVVEAIRSSYVCPSCKTHCITNIEVNVVRFNCIYCDRELIINSRERR